MYYSTHLSDLARVNRPNNCDFVGKSRTARPTFPGPRELRVIFCLNFSDGPEENPEDGEKSDASSDFLIVFHGKFLKKYSRMSRREIFLRYVYLGT